MDQPSLGEAARNLASWLQALGHAVPKDFEGSFIWNAKKLPPSAVEDFASLVLQEVLERTEEDSEQAPTRLILRAIDTVRHRLVREAVRRSNDLPWQHPGYVETAESDEGQMQVRVEVLMKHVRELGSVHMLILDGLIQGQSQAELVTQLGLSRSTIHRRVSEIREKYRALEESGEI